jgi:hypothetical protein
VQGPAEPRPLVVQRQPFAIGCADDIETRWQSSILDLEDVGEVRVELDDQLGLDRFVPEPRMMRSSCSPADARRRRFKKSVPGGNSPRWVRISGL